MIVNIILLIAFIVMAISILYQVIYHVFYPIIRVHRIKKLKKHINI